MSNKHTNDPKTLDQFNYGTHPPTVSFLTPWNMPYQRFTYFWLIFTQRYIVNRTKRNVNQIKQIYDTLSHPVSSDKKAKIQKDTFYRLKMTRKYVIERVRNLKKVQMIPQKCSRIKHAPLTRACVQIISNKHNQIL